MGTRHLIIVIDKNNALKVAQYGQWDGYPSGQGVDVLAFAKDKEKMARLEAELKNAKFYQDDKGLLMWVGGYNERCPHYDEEYNRKTEDRRNTRDNYWFNVLQTRDLGARILDNIIIVNKEALPKEHENFIVLDNDINFLKNSLFCEWAYIINFNTNKLQVLCGFNNDKCKEHELCITDQEQIDKKYENREKYYGCSLVKEYDLDNLPSEDEFLEDLEGNEDEE